MRANDSHHKSPSNLAFLNSVCSSNGRERVVGEGGGRRTDEIAKQINSANRSTLVGVGARWEAGWFLSTFEIILAASTCMHTLNYKLITNYPHLFAEVLSRSQRIVYSSCCCFGLEIWTKLLTCLAGTLCWFLEKSFPITTANRISWSWVIVTLRSNPDLFENFC